MPQGKVISLDIDWAPPDPEKWVIADLNQTPLFWASVKEQRVDGSSVSDKDIVRCTLVAGKSGSRRR